MPVRIRLARHGQKHTPYYHIVAINATKRRDARPLEKLGEYDPIPRSSGSASVERLEKKVEWNAERIRYWLGVGAEPTETVVKLLEKGGILTRPHKWQPHWSKTDTLTSLASSSKASPPSTSSPSTTTTPQQPEFTGLQGSVAT